jgi:hypothetical protein
MSVRESQHDTLSRGDGNDVGAGSRVRAPSQAADVLSIEPRGLGRIKAAAYIDVSPTKFDEMVKDGRMPPPKRIDGRKVWDRRRLDEAFEALPDDAADNSNNPWAEVL